MTRLFPASVWINIYFADWDQNSTPGDLSDDIVAPIPTWRVAQVVGVLESQPQVAPEGTESVDLLRVAAAEAVGNNIQGTMALPHPYGRLQFGPDLDLHFRTLIGTGCNPNVAAVIVIGIEPIWTDRIVKGIAKTGKPVAGFAIEFNGRNTAVLSMIKIQKPSNTNP